MKMNLTAKSAEKAQSSQSIKLFLLKFLKNIKITCQLVLLNLVLDFRISLTQSCEFVSAFQRP
jgi:hypothetical protein